MNPWVVPEAIAGGALLFFVPGYAVTRATFPRRRFRGPDGLRGALETVTLSFTLSVVLTVLVGFGLLRFSPGGFSAAWSDPVLEACLAGIAAVAFAIGLLEGSYSAEPPLPDPPEPGTEGVWELTRELDRLGREERRLLRAMARSKSDPTATGELERRLDEVRTEVRALEDRREAEYDL